jgi:hypothetical protein
MYHVYHRKAKFLLKSIVRLQEAVQHGNIDGDPAVRRRARASAG